MLSIGERSLDRPKADEIGCPALSCREYEADTSGRNGWGRYGRSGSGWRRRLGQLLHRQTQKSPVPATGLFLFSGPIALFSGRSSYSGRTGSCNEMTETNAGRMLMCCLPCRDTSGGHSELGLKGKDWHPSPTCHRTLSAPCLRDPDYPEVTF